MEHAYHLELNYLSALLYAAIFLYGIVAGVRDLYKLLGHLFKL